MDRLEFASNDELIQELFRRSTFAGVLIYSPENHRRSGQVHSDFHVRTTLDGIGSLFVLEKGIDALKEHKDHS